MMKKLVFDRALSINVKDRYSVTVPKSELWRITTTDEIRCNDRPTLSTATHHLVGENANLMYYGSSSMGSVEIVGIAFKIVEV